MVPTYKFVSEVKEQKLQGYVSPLEQKIRELKDKFDEVDFQLLPDIQHTYDELKPLQMWKNQVETTIISQVVLICEKVDIDILKDALEKLSFIIKFLEDFDKESNSVMEKYSPYRKKMDEIINFNWPSNVEYEQWKRIFIDELDL